LPQPKHSRGPYTKNKGRDNGLHQPTHLHYPQKARINRRVGLILQKQMRLFIKYLDFIMLALGAIEDNSKTANHL
jgi:hypothetical protein